MADSVATNIIFNGNRTYRANFSSVSDGTGEAAVKKIDISTLFDALGVAPTKAKIMKVNYAVSGMSLEILFDRTVTDEQAMVLVGSGEFDFTKGGGLQDPASAAGTGDILFTTHGHAANDGYNIDLEIALQ